MKPVDQGSKKRCQSPALPCPVVPGPSPASPRAHAASRAPAPPTSAPFSQHGLSSHGSACVSPGAKITAGFHPGTETSSKIFPGLHDTCCCPGSARHRGLWQEAVLCLTEPVTCQLPTVTCRALATCRAAGAERAWRCLPPSPVNPVTSPGLGHHPRLPVSHREPALGYQRRRLWEEEEGTAQAESWGGSGSLGQGALPLPVVLPAGEHSLPACSLHFLPQKAFWRLCTRPGVQGVPRAGRALRQVAQRLPC